MFMVIATAAVILWVVISRTGSPLGVIVNPQQEGNPTAMPTPAAGTATSTAKGSVADGTYYFRLTSVDYAGGQTKASEQFSCSISSYKNSCTVTLTPLTEAASTRLWIATTSGVYYGYKTATSSTLVATTTGMTAARLPQVSSAYYFNSGVDMDNTWLKSYATADTLVKSGKTLVHSVTFSGTDTAATAGTIGIMDSVTRGVGTSSLYYVNAAAVLPNTIILDQVFETGLFIDFTATNDVNVSVSYK